MTRDNWLHYAAVAALVIVILPFIGHAFPAIFGMDGSYVVVSGSMEPTISAGAVIWVQDVPAKNIQESDVITFADNGRGLPTTHRVIKKENSSSGPVFTTKGDANEDPDGENIYPRDIIGKVVFHIPLMGYIVLFAGSKIGKVVLVILPLTLLGMNEGWELFRAATKEETNEETTND